MPFSPGQSGNPAGRPSRAAELARRTRAAIGGQVEDLVRVLVAIARSPGTDRRTRVEAIRELLARGWGRPARVPDAETERAAGELQRLIRPCSAPRSRPDPADPLAALRRLASA